MSKILNKLKDPRRFINHFSIKFLNKKIKNFNDFENFFKGKKGLEIGGPSKIFTAEGYIPIYPLVSVVDGVNFSTQTVWENTIAEGQLYNFGNEKDGYQFIQDGTDLSIIESDSYDFVLSSHSLEHIANPLKAVKEWLRILKKGGVLVIILPDSRYTFDRNRTVTKFEHLLQDMESGTSEKDLTHLQEILSLHDLSYDDGVNGLDEFKSRSADNFLNRCLHHHVFNISLMEKIYEYFNVKIFLKHTSPPFNLIIMGTKQ